MEHATPNGEAWTDERRPDPPHGREREHRLRLAESTVTVQAPSANGRESRLTGACADRAQLHGWLIHRLQELGIPASASAAA